MASNGIPESVDDELVGLIENAKNLGRELAVMAANEPALRVARDKMVELSREASEYLYNLTWDRSQKKVWEDVGLQSEEDAEY